MFIGLVLVIAGIIFLLEKLGIVTGSVWNYVWPCLVIALGLSIILRRGCCGTRWSSHSHRTTDDKETK